MSRTRGSSGGGNRAQSKPTSSSRLLRENEVRGGGLLDFLSTLPDLLLRSSSDEDSYYDGDDYSCGSTSHTTFDEGTRHTRSDTMETLETLNLQLEELDSTINTAAVADAETVVDNDKDGADYDSDGSYGNGCKMFIDGEDNESLFSRMVDLLLPNFKDDNCMPKSEERRFALVPPTAPETSTPETRSEVQERRQPSVDQDRTNAVVEENARGAMKTIEEKTVYDETAHLSVDDVEKNTVYDKEPLPPKEGMPTPKAQSPTKGRFSTLRSPLAGRKEALTAAAAAAEEEAAIEAEAEKRRAERREKRRAQAVVRITVTHE